MEALEGRTPEEKILKLYNTKSEYQKSGVERGIPMHFFSNGEPRVDLCTSADETDI